MERCLGELELGTHTLRRVEQLGLDDNKGREA